MDHQLMTPEMWQFPMVAVPPQLQPSPAPRFGGRTGRDEESTVEQGAASKGKRKRRSFSAAGAGAASEDESSKIVSTSCGNDVNNTDAKHAKASKSTNENNTIKTEAEASSDICNKSVDQNPQSSELPKQDYIHVRARRGQATDSHSLAERARREKISERMKILQDLVPGCNKVIGKASVLDEIINYIQALQCQVEFLSMKLEAVNSRINPAIEMFPPKDFGSQTYDRASSLAFSSQAAIEYGQGSASDWLHMQVGGAFERVT